MARILKAVFALQVGKALGCNTIAPDENTANDSSTDPDLICAYNMIWAKRTGITQHSEWYTNFTGLSSSSPYEDFQCALHHMVGSGSSNGRGHNCTEPCSSSLTQCGGSGTAASGPSPTAPPTAAQTGNATAEESSSSSSSSSNSSSSLPWWVWLLLGLLFLGVMGALAFLFLQGQGKKTSQKKKRAVKPPAAAKEQPKEEPKTEAVAPASSFVATYTHPAVPVETFAQPIPTYAAPAVYAAPVSYASVTAPTAIQSVAAPAAIHSVTAPTAIQSVTYAAPSVSVPLASASVPMAISSVSAPVAVASASVPVVAASASVPAAIGGSVSVPATAMPVVP